MTDDTDIIPAEERQRPIRAALGGGTKTLLVATLLCSLATVGVSGVALSTALKLRNAQTQSMDFAGQARAYIESHPEVIVESVNNAEARKKEAEAKEAVDQLVARNDEIFADAAAPVDGNAAGDATLVEFFDYNCHYCKSAAPIVAQLKQADPGVRIVYKEFPILGPGSSFAAHAALAAQKQGKYVAFHDALYASRGAITEASTMEIAKSVGLDVVRLKNDMTDPAIDAAIKKNLALAETLRVTGTPTFISRKNITPGLVDLDTLKQMMAEARKG